MNNWVVVRLCNSVGVSAFKLLELSAFNCAVVRALISVAVKLVIWPVDNRLS